MTDTMVEETTKTRAEAQVDKLFDVGGENWDEIPTARKGRESKIDPLLEQIRGAKSMHGREAGVALYDKAEQAKGATVALRNRLGGPDVSGFTFGVKWHKDQGKYAVTAKFEPGKINAEKVEQFKVKRAEDMEKARIKQREQAAKKKAEEAAQAQAA